MPGGLLNPCFFAISLSLHLTTLIPYSAASSSINSMCRRILGTLVSPSISERLKYVDNQPYKIHVS